jgi:hypothetical protein
MNYQILTSAEKIQLVMMILESVDQPMEFDEFQETISLMCEDISGLETQSEDSFSALVTDCWEIYQHTLLPNASHQ